MCVDVRFRLHGGHCDKVVRDVPALACGERFCQVPFRILPERPNTRQHHRERLRVCHISRRRWPTDATDRFTPLNRCDRLVEPIVHEAEMETHRKHQQIENRPDKQQLLSLRAEFRLPSSHCEEAETIKQVCERAEGLEL